MCYSPKPAKLEFQYTKILLGFLNLAYTFKLVKTGRYSETWITSIGLTSTVLFPCARGDLSLT